MTVTDYDRATEHLERTRRDADNAIAAASLHRARTLLRLHVSDGWLPVQMRPGWTVREIAAEVDLHPSRVGAMLDQAKRDLDVHHVRAYYGDLHPRCAAERILDERFRGDVDALSSQRAGWRSRMDYYGEATAVRELCEELGVDPEEYAPTVTPAAEMSPRAVCVRETCRRPLWLWRLTEGLPASHNSAS